MSIKSYRDLIAWQKSVVLMKSIYRLTANWPREELYALTSQIKRAAVSVPSNIAEGHGRRTTADYLRHLRIAYASLMECEAQLQISYELGFTRERELSGVIDQVNEVGKIMNGLIASLSHKTHSRKSSSQALTPEP